AEVGHRRVDGTTFPTLMTTTLLRNENGEPIGFAGIATDITSSKKAEETIKEERNRAEFYLDLMSHDITNIHQGIYSWVQVMNLKKGSGIDIDTDITPIEDLVKRSIKLVRNVQLLSRLRNTDPELKRIDLSAVLKECEKGIKSIFHNADLKINSRYPERPVNIMAEPLISEVFTNILHNAVKFQPDDRAVIEISLTSSPEGLAVVQIADHGPGIPDEIKPQIFDRFRRKEHRYHAGIGLSLVKELVDRYHGTVEVMDRVKKHSSRGTCFIVKFPLADG
ncbi:MAG TPA: HAMP domain-containing histidine kinase, partial [Euryarchaeota archaeon]|nr:HAMP domain-containing histidine kinase [Euryarchaeota archaeon]